jgi:hypothetical protein
VNAALEPAIFELREHLHEQATQAEDKACERYATATARDKTGNSQPSLRLHAGQAP